MIPDPFEKKTKIPIKIVDGKIQYFYGGELPKIKDGTIGDLIIPTYAVEDSKQLNVLMQERIITALPEGSYLLARIRAVKWDELNKLEQQYLESAKNIYPNLPDQFLSPDCYPVEIVLIEPLKLRLRGSKDADLQDCKCHLVSLDQSATSINHAYTRLSEVFEKHRKSHGGNVFDQVLYRDESGKWQQLRVLRNQIEANEEQKLLYFST